MSKLTAILAVLLCTAAAYAGPSITLGGGVGWVDGLWIAPAIGVEGIIADPLGLVLDTHVGFFGTLPGWEMALGSFSSLALTANLRSHPEGPQFYVLGGVGTPAVAGINQGGFVIEGIDFGWVLGIGMKLDGLGFKVLSYFTEGFVGVGLSAYLAFEL